MGPHIDAWFREVLQWAREAGLTPARRGALDGSFLGANASRHHLLNEERLEKRSGELQRQCAADTQDADAAETVPAWMAKTSATRLAQAERYTQAKGRLEEFHAINQRQQPSHRRPRHKIVVSATDPPAAIGWDKFKVFRPLYNFQLMRDLDSPLALAFDVFAQNTDGGLFQPMVQRARRDMQLPLAEVACDATFVTACNLAVCAQEHLTLYGPWRENEVLFRTLKSGCRVEERLFEHIDRLLPCAAVYLIVAWRTLMVVRLGRSCPELNCEAVFEPSEWKSVWTVIHRKKPPRKPPNLAEMVRLIGQLGGYINRPNRTDPPGPQTVWLGLQRMSDLAWGWDTFGPGAKNGP